MTGRDSANVQRWRTFAGGCRMFHSSNTTLTSIPTPTPTVKTRPCQTRPPPTPMHACDRRKIVRTTRGDNATRSQLTLNPCFHFVNARCDRPRHTEHTEPEPDVGSKRFEHPRTVHRSCWVGYAGEGCGNGGDGAATDMADGAVTWPETECGSTGEEKAEEERRRRDW